MNQDSILIDLDVEEHEMIMDLIRTHIDMMDMMVGGELSFYNLPPDNVMRKRYMKLNDLFQEVVTLWTKRFDDNNLLQPEHIGSTK